MSLKHYSVAITKEVSEPFWPRLETQRWRKADSWNFRIGWRYTALGLHLRRQTLSDTEMDQIAADAKKETA